MRVSGILLWRNPEERLQTQGTVDGTLGVSILPCLLPCGLCGPRTEKAREHAPTPEGHNPLEIANVDMAKELEEPSRIPGLDVLGLSTTTDPAGSLSRQLTWQREQPRPTHV